MKLSVTVEEWVSLFREIGMSEAQMQAWHRVFEKEHPEAHEGFLHWLGLPEDKKAAIRARAR